MLGLTVSAFELRKEGEWRERGEGRDGGGGNKTRQRVIKADDKVTFISSDTFKLIFVHTLATIPLTTT